MHTSFQCPCAPDISLATSQAYSPTYVCTFLVYCPVTPSYLGHYASSIGTVHATVTYACHIIYAKTIWQFTATAYMYVIITKTSKPTFTSKLHELGGRRRGMKSHIIPVPDCKTTAGTYVSCTSLIITKAPANVLQLIKYSKIQPNTYLLESSKHANLVRAERCDIKRKQLHNLQPMAWSTPSVQGNQCLAQYWRTLITWLRRERDMQEAWLQVLLTFFWWHKTKVHFVCFAWEPVEAAPQTTPLPLIEQRGINYRQVSITR